MVSCGQTGRFGRDHSFVVEATALQVGAAALEVGAAALGVGATQLTEDTLQVCKSLRRQLG